MRCFPDLYVCVRELLLPLHVERAFGFCLALSTPEMGDEFGNLAFRLQVFDILLMRFFQVLASLFFGFGELGVVPFRYSRLRLPVVLVAHDFFFFFLTLISEFSHSGRILRLCKSLIVVQDFGIHALCLVSYLRQCRPLFFRCLPPQSFRVLVELLVQVINRLLRYT